MATPRSDRHGLDTADEDGFAYVDDAFRVTTQPAYADGNYEPAGRRRRPAGPAFPLDDEDIVDNDDDGTGDNADTDDDRSPCRSDVDEEHGPDEPTCDDGSRTTRTPSRSTMPRGHNTDVDGIGDNADIDDDNDGVGCAYDWATLMTTTEVAGTSMDGVGDAARRRRRRRRVLRWTTTPLQLDDLPRDR